MTERILAMSVSSESKGVIEISFDRLSSSRYPCPLCGRTSKFQEHSRRLDWTSDLTGPIIDIGLQRKHWINLGIIINKSYYSYKL